MMKALPATARGRRTRETILSTAAQIMEHQGISGPSVDDVLAASGTGKSQFYHYFDSRRDLTEAVLHHQFTRILAAQPSLQDPDCTDLQTWRDEVVTAHRVNGYGMCPLGVFVGQLDDEPELSACCLSERFAWAATLSDDLGAVRA
jgi:AcrR family transcriptional regulator